MTRNKIMIYSKKDSETCNICGHIYQVIKLEESIDYKDHGYRHCPFCGSMQGMFALVKYE